MQLCPSDRKERRLLGTRETKGEDEEADTQKWKSEKMGVCRGVGGKNYFSVTAKGWIQY